jgi:predicted RNase H-like nuclease
MPSDTMENWTLKVEPVEQVDTTQNTVKIKAEPDDEDLIMSCIDIEEHPVKLEEEQSDALICGLPAQDTEISD